MAIEPRTFEEAKKLVGGDLGLEMSKYPLQFARAAYFGVPAVAGEQMPVNNGTASLLRLEGKPMLLTCAHVLQG